MTMIDPEPEAETSIQNASRKHVLVEAYCAVNGQRRADYGPALESFQRIADIASAGLAHKLTEPLEQDAFSGWRRFIRFRPGERALIKRKANRRERRSARQTLEVGK